MIENVPSMKKLVHELTRLPGVGPKSAQRLAYHLLRAKGEYVTDLTDALQQVQELVHECPNCFSFTEEELCHFCNDPQRTDEVICVVEDPADIRPIEASGVFKGRYHVLHGAISPLDGVTPQDLKIQALMDKVNDGLEEKRAVVSEVILALDADLEGDTTVLYLAKMLQEKGVKTSRIAHGVPIGGDIDYIDNRTLGRALENRVQL